MTGLQSIARMYDREAEAEYHRLTKTPVHEAEFELTVELLSEYILPGTSVLDVGAGPGRYAQFLIEQLDCRVGLVDLIGDLLQTFLRRLDGKHQDHVAFTRVASATDLGWLDGDSFDTVLLMGPLYHLKDNSERRAAIEHYCRILKPCGYIFAAFLSPYPKLVSLLSNGGALLTSQDYLRDLCDLGITQTAFEDFTVDWFRCWPSQAIQMMESVGVQTIRVRNLEGIGAVLNKA